MPPHTTTNSVAIEEDEKKMFVFDRKKKSHDVTEKSKHFNQK